MPANNPFCVVKWGSSIHGQPVLHKLSRRRPLCCLLFYLFSRPAQEKTIFLPYFVYIHAFFVVVVQLSISVKFVCSQALFWSC